MGELPLLRQLLHARRCGHAGRFAEHAAGAAQELLRGHDLGVGDVDREAAGLPDGAEGLVRVPGHAHGDGVGQGVLLHGTPGLPGLHGPVQGTAPLRLSGDQPGQTGDEPYSVQVLEALPHSGDGAAVAHGDGDIVRDHPAQLLHDLQGHGLLALGEVGVYRGVAVVPAPAANGGAAEGKGVLIGPLDGDDRRAEGHELGHLALGGPAGDEDIGLQARGGGVPGQRAGGVAGGGAGDDPGSRLPGLGHGHGAGPVLQGGGGVEAVVLHPELPEAQLLCKLPGLVEGAPAHPQGRQDGVLLHREEFPAAPHGALLPAGQNVLGQSRLDIRIVINNVENTAARAGGQVRHGRNGPPAAGALGVLDVLHGCLLAGFSRGPAKHWRFNRFMNRLPPP